MFNPGDLICFRPLGLREKNTVSRECVPLYSNADYRLDYVRTGFVYTNDTCFVLGLKPSPDCDVTYMLILSSSSVIGWTSTWRYFERIT